MNAIKQQAEEIILDYREEMYMYDFQVDCIIHEAFPEFPIEEIQAWNNFKTMFYLSRAEFILKELRGVPLLSVEEVAAMQNGQVQEQEEQPQYQQYFEAAPKQEVYPEFQEQFDRMAPPENYQEDSPPPPPPPRKAPAPAKEGGLSEDELMALLGNSEANKGRTIKDPHMGQGLGKSQMFPELNWFKAEADLKGEFD